MAIDTANKRRSVSGCGLGFLAMPPVPNGTLDAFDREQIAGFYAGIQADVPPEPSGGNFGRGRYVGFYRPRYKLKYRG